MPRLREHLDGLRGKGKKALAVFLTAGDPSLEDLPRLMHAVADGGADVIELGVPFSDPIADGPTIQAASQRALDAGASLAGILEAVQGFDRVPTLLMGYTNPMLAYGLERLARDCRASGVSATLVCDALPEESDEWRAISAVNGLDTVFLASPTCTDERLRVVCEASTGFVYAVSRTGVTGSDDRISSQAQPLVGRLRAHTDAPVLVGFGVSGPAHVAEVCSFADGAVVGSAVVRTIQLEWRADNGPEELARFVADLKSGAA
jgi:tryptophan synthase alpha chain